MQPPRLEQWLTPTARGFAASLVVDRAHGTPEGAVAGRGLDHPALPFVLVAAFANGEKPRGLSGVRALVVRLDATATGLVDGVESTLALARFAEFIEVAVSVASAASMPIARVSVESGGASSGGLAFSPVDAAIDGDVVLLWRAALFMLADARGFTIDTLELDIDGTRRVVDGAAVITSA